jgi:hypothetical protein
MLGMGLLGGANPVLLDRLLEELLDRAAGGQPKAVARWYRDLILAAEIGADRDWTYLRTRPMVRVDRWQRDLRAGLAELLADRDQPLPVAERVRAGFLLGDLGDPRIPVTSDEWRVAIRAMVAQDAASDSSRITHHSPPTSAASSRAPTWLAAATTTRTPRTRKNRSTPSLSPSPSGSRATRSPTPNRRRGSSRPAGRRRTPPMMLTSTAATSRWSASPGTWRTRFVPG